MFEKLKISTQELEASCKKWGMKINLDKCKIISVDDSNILIDGEVVKKVKEFVFLESVVLGSAQDVNRRIRLAMSGYG